MPFVIQFKILLPKLRSERLNWENVVLYEKWHEFEDLSKLIDTSSLFAIQRPYCLGKDVVSRQIGF